MADTISTISGITEGYLDVRYGNSQLIPAPLITFNQTIERDDAGTRETIIETRTLNGVILVASGGYHNVYGKQTQLEEAFSIDNQEFTIRATAGNPCLEEGTFILSGIYPRVASIDIEENLHYNRLNYSIVLENFVTVSGLSGVVDNFSNSWSYTENENECSVDISHTISAQGINTANSSQPSNALDNAKARVNQFLGLQSAPSGFPFYTQPTSGSTVGFYEVSTSRSETVNPQDGSYSVTEEFKLVSGIQPYIDERTAQYVLDDNSIATITIQGTVRGLGRTNDGAPEADGRSSGGTGFNNALSGFNNNIRGNLFTDAQTIYNRYNGAATLSSGIQALSIAQNPCNGTISYSISFTDDPTEVLPSGIQERTCSVQINNAVREVALQTVPFRALGPIFQRICTTTPGTYQVQCSVTAVNTGDRVSDTNRALEFAENEMIRLSPNPSDYTDIYISSRSKTIDDTNRSITASITWTFSENLDQIPGDSADVTLGRIS